MVASHTPLYPATGLPASPSLKSRRASSTICSSSASHIVQSKSYTEPIRRGSRKDVRWPHIEAVLEKDVGVLVIPDFCPKEAAEHGAEGLARMEQGAYPNVPEVGKAGNMPSLYEVRGDAVREAHYFQKGPRVMQQFCAASPSYAPPMDMAHLMLDEVSPSGAMLLNIPGMGKARIGLCHVMHNLVKAHRDQLEVDQGMTLEKLDHFLGYVSQLAMNVYIKVPDQGGELQLWNVEMPDENFDAFSEGTCGIHPTRLPLPDAEYKPAHGDLAFFNSRNLHAINAGTGGIGLSQSNFLKWAGNNRPLGLWS